MASKKSIIKGFGAIKTIYNYFGKDTDLELLIDTWHSLLDGYTDEEFERGLFMALKQCKFAPVPADVIENIVALRNSQKPCETELWSMYHKALKDVLYYSHRLEYNYVDASGLSQGQQARREIEKIWNSLPEELRIFVGDKSELIENAKALNYTEVSFERNRFSKVFPQLSKRVEDKRIFLEIAAGAKLLE